tara:strand:- start:508 stop:1197 length:690 start_codon:yes stop_codon:yes gene_type:complete
MIHQKLVAKTIYLSLIVQLVTTIVSLDGLNYTLHPDDDILKDILLLEAFVQFIEAGFYIWVIHSLKDLDKMTSRRYIDWFITTPTMLVSTIIFMEYLRKKKNNENRLQFWDFIRDHKQNIIKIILYNFLMLLFGILYETKIINSGVSILLGFIFFLLSFHTIYDNYAKYTDGGRKLFIFLFFIWSLYGFTSILPIIPKNISYNMLDIVAKNFYGLFIYYYISQVGEKKS